MERGKKIGALQKSRDYIRTVLTIRFGEVFGGIDRFLEQVSDLSVLDECLKLAIAVDSLEDFRQAIAEIQFQS